MDFLLIRLSLELLRDESVDYLKYDLEPLLKRKQPAVAADAYLLSTKAQLDDKKVAANATDNEQLDFHPFKPIRLRPVYLYMDLIRFLVTCYGPLLGGQPDQNTRPFPRPLRVMRD